MKAPYGRVETSISQGPFHSRDPSLGCWPRHSLANSPKQSSPTCPPTVVKGTGSLKLGQGGKGKEGNQIRSRRGLRLGFLSLLFIGWNPLPLFNHPLPYPIHPSK